MIFFLVAITAIGMIASFKVSNWHMRYYKYFDTLGCPLIYTKSTLTRLFCLSFPIGLFIIALAITKSYSFLILVLFLLSAEMGVRRAKREYIKMMTEYSIHDAKRQL
jgi:hypothetical protein